MPLTVLSDDDVKTLLQSLTSSEVSDLALALGDALARMSCGSEGDYQPQRSVVKRPGGQVTLFMPATSEQSVGVKIVGIKPTADKPTTAGGDSKPQPALQSVLTICDSLGRAVGILNAAALTAFRTALGSMLLYRSRQATRHIVVFGAGKQALWHLRLALVLRGEDIQKLTIVNRSKQRSLELIESVQRLGCPPHISMEALDRESIPESALEDTVVSADVIFCTTPSTRPLFPASFLTSGRARSKSRYISAIGSYRLDMAEIDPELLKAVVDPSGIFASQVWQGRVAVDSSDGCLHEAGELVTAGLTRVQMLEVGQIYDDDDDDNLPGLRDWLRSGFVIYKSVGVGTMDIAIAEYLINLARSRSVGLTAAF
ncbi:ornithine cyclodeaminase [Moelleriella libera RCEF 2490]|uniref:Ornithine cyclodeaminase n=1 Tax=Moelleriella libera RCEF 2490 TaxID=1081109 RepID=A0A166V5J0_9HYPO|nr:ornithine cyclodeaminase [Moelleriella libera RCEF 2490]